MALSDITTTGWILALLKRDDGQTLLLGSGAYDFKESQQHFTPNTYANDVVELQGTDGQLLTGQVRRSTAQSFDGFVGEAGMTRADVEQYRRQFLMFFRRGHKYTVIYIFPDGTAIKRDRGYIVDAPSVPELYQILPEYHVALAFEDVNYYSYAEDSSGNETFAFNAHLNLSDVQGGGLKWDANGAISSPTGLGNIRINGDTYQQSYTGKNLLGASLATMQSENTAGTWRDGAYTLNGVTFTPVFSNGVLQRIELSGTATSNVNFRIAKSYSKAEFEAIVTEGETYTLSGCPSGGSSTTYYLRVLENPYKNLYTDTGTGYTKQMPSLSSDTTSVRLVIGIDSGTDSTGLVFKPQFEKSATATSYEPYVGGQAIPNPDYPQPVQTVTGQQTVEINGADYTLDLGAIELCKLSTYQDYIWKDGEDWKVHKATESVTLTGSENWQYRTAGTTADFYQIGNANWNDYFGADTNAIGTGSTDVQPISAFAADKLTSIDANDANMKANEGIGKKGQWFRISLLTSRGVTTVDDFKTWLASNNIKTYYALATATDTTITDATLIAQLNAIEEAIGTDGQPTAIVPTGDNLAAIITGEPNGTGGYEWEASEGGGPTFITVTGIDDAQPVWKVVGPATNPTLTNSTSGVSITWNGTVPNNQTLIVDMGAQTATLEGANVFAFISGSWLTLEPGTNRIAYTAGNTTNGCDIYWNEIVG